MTRHIPVNCIIKSALEFVYEALNTVGYSTFTSGCLSHALQVHLYVISGLLTNRSTDFICFIHVWQSEAVALLLPSWVQMSSFLIRLLRKTSDVSPHENDKLKITDKEE